MVLKLEQERLVVIDRDPNSGAATVELAHEALILSWARLCDWINEDREFLRAYERIATDARLWDAEGRPADLLLPVGRRLAEGERLLGSRPGDLDPQFITYVHLSAAAARETQGGFNKLFHFFGVSAAWDELEKRKKAVDEVRHQIRQLEMRELEMNKELSLRETIIARASHDTDYTSPMVFLSYASEDGEFVRQLANIFRGYGFRTWFDKDDILPGQRWKSAIEKAIKEAHFLMFCISRHSSIKRGFIQVEQKLALEVARSIPDDQIYLIPTLSLRGSKNVRFDLP